MIFPTGLYSDADKGFTFLSIFPSTVKGRAILPYRGTSQSEGLKAKAKAEARG